MPSCIGEGTMEKALPLRISLYKSEQKKHVSFTEGTSHEHTTRGENEAIQATPNTRSMKLPRDSITRECAGKRNLFQRTLLSRCPCLSELPQLCARQYSCHSLKSVRVSASLVGYVSKCPRACLPFQVRLSRATWPVPFPCVDSLKKCDVGFRHGFSSKCTLLKSKITFTNLAYTSNPTIWKVCSVHQQRRGASGRSPPRHSCRWS
jgi:hypothetical protein